MRMVSLDEHFATAYGIFTGAPKQVAVFSATSSPSLMSKPKLNRAQEYRAGLPIVGRERPRVERRGRFYRGRRIRLWGRIPLKRAPAPPSDGAPRATHRQRDRRRCLQRGGARDELVLPP